MNTVRTNPELGAKVDLTVRIEDGVTRRAFNGVVRQRRWRRALRIHLFQRRVQRAKGCHAARRFQSTGRPTVKRQARPEHVFGRGHVPLLFHDLLLLLMRCWVFFLFVDG